MGVGSQRFESSHPEPKRGEGEVKRGACFSGTPVGHTDNENQFRRVSREELAGKHFYAAVIGDELWDVIISSLADTKSELPPGIIYRTGLIEDPRPLTIEALEKTRKTRKTADTVGVPFTDAESIFYALPSFGKMFDGYAEYSQAYYYVRKITIPENAVVFYDAKNNAYRASSVVAGKLRTWQDAFPELLKYGAATHEKLAHGALFWAVSRGHCDCIRLLVEYGVDVNRPLNKLYYPSYLSLAVHYGHFDAAQTLVECGANIHVDDEHALGTAVRRDDQKTFEFLRDKGAVIKNKHIVESIWNGSSHIAPILLEYASEKGISTKSLDESSKFFRWSVHYPTIVKALIKSGLKPSEDDFFEAIKEGEADTMKLIAATGINVHCQKNKAYKLARFYGDGRLKVLRDIDHVTKVMRAKCKTRREHIYRRVTG